MWNHANEDSYNDMAAPIEVDVPQGSRLQMVIECFTGVPQQCDIHPVNVQEYLERHVR